MNDPISRPKAKPLFQIHIKTFPSILTLLSRRICSPYKIRISGLIRTPRLSPIQVSEVSEENKIIREEGFVINPNSSALRRPFIPLPTHNRAHLWSPQILPRLELFWIYNCVVRLIALRHRPRAESDIAR